MTIQIITKKGQRQKTHCDYFPDAYMKMRFGCSCQMTSYVPRHIQKKWVWWSSSLLHTGGKFLFPALWWNPRPLKLQLLFNVILLTLLEEWGVLVAIGWQLKKKKKINYIIRGNWTVIFGSRSTIMKIVDEQKHNSHCAVRHSFIAAFSSRHLNTIKKPDSLQQWVKAEE